MTSVAPERREVELLRDPLFGSHFAIGDSARQIKLALGLPGASPDIVFIPREDFNDTMETLVRRGLVVTIRDGSAEI